MTDSRRNPLELLAEDFLDRYRRGERPAMSEYVVRHAELADEIRELFPVLLELEEATPQSQADTPDAHPAGPSKATACPEQIGDYRIIREIGRGGMGVVYEAVHQSLGRNVALKVLPSHAGQDEMAIKRFHREARAAAKLHHTNIVPVFDVGQDGPTCFYAMQYIEGQPLHLVIRELRRYRATSRISTLAQNVHARLQMFSTATDRQSAESGGQCEPAVEQDSQISHATTIAAGKLPPSTPRQTQPPRSAWNESPAVSSMAGDSHRASWEADSHFFHKVAGVGLQVTQALAYAHARGVVHRDIKPSNLLLDTNGVVWVTDFGMAKTDAEPLTRTGDLLGTLHYMAPERFKGECDARTDIYSVGLTMYELVTLKSAFRAQDRLQLMELITNHHPPRPRSVNPRIPRDLETIVLKAIDKDRQRRYQTAAELADDLQCFVEDRPIRARRINPAERFLRWTRRNPLLSGLSIAMALFLIVAAVTATVAAIVLENSRSRAQTAERVATQRARQAAAQAEQLRQQDYVHRVNLAYLEWRNDNVARALELLDACPPSMRGWEWDFVKSQCQPALRTMRESGQSVNCVAFSPDGRRIAVGTGNFLGRHGTPGDLLVRDTWTGELLLAKRNLPDGVSAVAFSPDGRRLASANGRQLTVWDAQTGAIEFIQADDSLDLLSLDFSPNGQLIAGGFGRFNASQRGYASIWDTQSGEEVDRIAGQSGGVWSVCFDPSGSRLALTGEGLIEIWDIDQHLLLQKLTGHNGFVYCVAFQPQGHYLASGGLDRTIRLWDVETGESMRVYSGHAGFVRSIAFSPDGAQIISGSEDKSVKLWDLESERELATFRGHTHFVNCVAYSHDDRIFVSGGLDQTVRLWFASADHQLTYEGHEDQGHPRALAYSPNGTSLVSGSFRFSGPNDRLHMWNPSTGERSVRFPPHVGEVATVDFRPDGARLVTGHPDGSVQVWDATSGRLIRKLEAHVGEVAAVRFSPDGTLLASAGQDTGVNIWNADTGQLLRTAVGHHRFVMSIDFSPDGNRMVSASLDGTARIWETATAKQVATLQHRGEVRGVAFSPNGNALVTTGGIHHRLGEVRIWNAADGKLQHDLSGHTDIVYGVDFSPDGKRLATASDDRTVKLWDPQTGREVFAIRGHTGGVLSVAFSPSGREIASSSVDRTVRVWSLDAADVGTYFQRVAVRVAEQGERDFAARRWHAAVKAFDRALELGHRNRLRLQLYRALAKAASEQTVLESPQLDVAIEAADTDWRRMLELAALLSRHGQPAAALDVMDRAVALAPNESAVCATAARLHAAIGDADRAGELLQQALSSEISLHSGSKQANDNGPWYWEAGWWAQGPFPPDLQTVDDEESLVSPFGGMVSDQSLVRPPRSRWQLLDHDGDRFLDLAPWTTSEERTSTYALQHVFASEQHDVALLVDTDDTARIWLNDELLFEQVRSRDNAVAVAATLRTGWNKIMVKVANNTGPHGLYLEISAEPRDLAAAYARQTEWERIDGIWATASGPQRDDWQLLSNVGEAFARRGRWQEAVDVFARLVERQPTRNRNWIKLAPLLAYLEDLPKYERLRRDMLRMFGQTDDEIIAERTSKVCLLLPYTGRPDALPFQLASRAVEQGEGHSFYAYFLLAEGISAYRQSQFTRAITSLELSQQRNGGRDPYLEVVGLMFRAMAHHQSQQPAEATRYFEAATEIQYSALPSDDSRDFGSAWPDWLIYQIARREAQRLLETGTHHAL